MVRRRLAAAVLAAAIAIAGLLAVDRSGASTTPKVSLPKARVDQVEGNSGTTVVTLTASLGAAASSTVTVAYTTVDGTAKAGDGDYVATSGTLTFSPGQTSRPIDVSIKGDTKLEDYETFSVRLSNPSGASLGNATEKIQILNDETPKLTMANLRKVTEGQNASFKPKLVQRYYQPITLNAQTHDGTATAPADYGALNRSITFAAGTKGPVTTAVSTVADGVTEPAEDFTLTVSGSGILSSVTRKATITSQLCTGAAPPAKYDHVVIVVMENKKYGGVIGTSAAPFLTMLARGCASATKYAQVASPSRPNYIAMTAGSVFGCAGSNADPPGGCTPTSPSLFAQVLGAGGTVRSYAQGMNGNCETVSHDLYAVKHNPWPYFTAEAADCAQYDQPLPAALDTANLPTLTFVSPDLCNDSHNCSVATGDAFLAGLLQPVLNSTAYLSGSTAVIVAYDEYTPLPNAFAARSVKAGVKVTSATDHYALLRTVEDMLGLPPLGAAGTATSLRTAMHL